MSFVDQTLRHVCIDGNIAVGTVQNCSKVGHRVWGTYNQTATVPGADDARMETDIEPTRLYGHPFFYVQLAEERKLHSEKNHDYAKGGDALGNFKRVSSILALYPGLDLSNPVVVCLVYMLKQLDAVLWGLSQKITHKVEGYHPRLQDISIYAKIARCILHDTDSPKAKMPW